MLVLEVTLRIVPLREISPLLGRLQPTRQPLQTVTLPISGSIFNILLEMKKQGRSDYSINFTRKALSFLAKHCNLNEPESIRTFVANYNTSSGYKRNLCIAYNKYVKFYGLSWNMPLYKAPEKMPKIPSTEKIEMLISSSSKKLALKLKLSMETGLRPIELMNLRVEDIDFDNRTVHPSTAKGGSSRMLKITQGTTDMLKVHIVKHNLGSTDRLFKGSSNDYSKHFRAMRNKLSIKLQDPSVRQIRLYDLRHYFATMTYHKTRDILFTKAQMGHRKIETTLLYTQLLNLNEAEFTSAVAKNTDEVCKLIEQGFEFVCDMDWIKLFRKRK